MFVPCYVPLHRIICGWKPQTMYWAKLTVNYKGRKDSLSKELFFIQYEHMKGLFVFSAKGQTKRTHTIILHNSTRYNNKLNSKSLKKNWPVHTTIWPDNIELQDDDFLQLYPTTPTSETSLFQQVPIFET